MRRAIAGEEGDLARGSRRWEKKNQDYAMMKYKLISKSFSFQLKKVVAMRLKSHPATLYPC